MISIIEENNRTQMTIKARFTRVGSLPVPYTNQVIAPDRIQVTFDFQFATVPGRTRVTQLSVSGHRVLKPTSNGGQRLSEDRRDVNWSGNRTGDIRQARELPGWLRNVLAQLDPGDGGVFVD